MTNFPTNNDEIIKNIDYFCNETLKNYSSKRNFVLGSPHNNVSKFSPYIRRRVITEEQILKKIIKNKSDFKIDEFVIQLFLKKGFEESQKGPSECLVVVRAPENGTHETQWVRTKHI